MASIQYRIRRIRVNEITVTIHRATHEIGGNCIEIAAKGERILLDAGRPLDASDDEVSGGLVPGTLDLERPVAGVLLSHSHQDHYGILDETALQAGQCIAAKLRNRSSALLLESLIKPRLSSSEIGKATFPLCWGLFTSRLFSRIIQRSMLTCC